MKRKRRAKRESAWDILGLKPQFNFAPETRGRLAKAILRLLGRKATIGKRVIG